MHILKCMLAVLVWLAKFLVALAAGYAVLAPAFTGHYIGSYYEGPLEAIRWRIYGLTLVFGGMLPALAYLSCVYVLAPRWKALRIAIPLMLLLALGWWVMLKRFQFRNVSHVYELESVHWPLVLMQPVSLVLIACILLWAGWSRDKRRIAQADVPIA